MKCFEDFELVWFEMVGLKWFGVFLAPTLLNQALMQPQSLPCPTQCFCLQPQSLLCLAFAMLQKQQGHKTCWKTQRFCRITNNNNLKIRCQARPAMWLQGQARGKGRWGQGQGWLEQDPRDPRNLGVQPPSPVAALGTYM